jgi:endonuclease III
MTDTRSKIGPTDLGIDLRRSTDSEVFRWLVACQLFGARISQDIAAKTFTELDRAGMVTPRRLADADWQHLVDLLGKGGYRRYDESTARELIEVGKHAVEKYGGEITRIREDASSKKEVGERLQEFKGVGPTSADIFLREMAPKWKL